MTSLAIATRRTAAVLAAAVVAFAGAVLLGPTLPANAAACEGPGGVVVLVDFAELGGGLQAGCAQAGTSAAAAMSTSGFALDYATRSPGFVCRINGAPADDPCVQAAPADRYWSVWWADGRGGGWVYSSLGVGGLKVPDGGYVALAWHQGAGKAQAPAAVPTRRVAQPQTAKSETARPTASPKTRPTKQPTPVETPSETAEPTQTPTRTSSPAASPTEAATVTENPKPEPTRAPKSEATVPTGAPNDADTAGADTAKAQQDDELPSAADISQGPETVAPATATDGGLPTWVPVGVIVALIGAAGILTLRRRRG